MENYTLLPEISNIIPLLLLALPVFAVIDIINSEFKDNTNKIVWILVVLFMPCIGVILYLGLGPSQKVR